MSFRYYGPKGVERRTFGIQLRIGRGFVLRIDLGRRLFYIGIP